MPLSMCGHGDALVDLRFEFVWSLPAMDTEPHAKTRVLRDKNVKRKIERGVAFPTCISVNNTICHFSPLASDETVLEEGDMLKM